MKRSNEIGWAQVRAGIFIVVVLVLTAVAILLMGQKTKMFMRTSMISIVMKNVVGLKVGAPVWLAGVDIGVVREVTFEDAEHSNRVLIVADVDTDAHRKIGADSIITIKTRGLMGEKYVDILPSATYQKNPPTNFVGQSVHTLDDVAQKAGVTFERINQVVDTIQSGNGTLGKLARDPQLYINAVQLTTELQQLATSLNRGQGTVGRLIKSPEPYDRLVKILERADRMLLEVQTADGSLNKLIHDKELYTKLVTLADKSNQAASDVRELNRRLTSKDSTLGMLINDKELYQKGVTLLSRADTSMRELEGLLRKIKEGDGTAARLVNDRDVYDKLYRVVDQLNLLVEDVRRNPSRYIRFSLF